MSNNEKLLLYINGNIYQAEFDTKKKIIEYIKKYTIINHYFKRLVDKDNGKREVIIYLSDDEKRAVTFYIETVKK